MANTIETIKKSVLKYVTAGILGIMAFLASKLAHDVLPVLHLSPLNELWQKSQNTLIALLSLAFLLSFTFLIHYRKKSFVLPPSGGYIFQEDPGYYISKKTQGHYCNPCLSRGFASRLSIHHEDGLKCRLCGEIYIDPKSENAAYIEYCEKQKTT